MSTQRAESTHAAAGAAGFSERYDPLILDPMIRDFYGGTGFYNVGLWREGPRDQAEASQHLVGELVQRLPPGGRTFLDVACGLGATSQVLKEHRPEAEVTGINISALQLEHCRREAPGCQFMRMDAARMTFPEASFDGVVCVEASFHFDTRADFLRHALRVLKPSGTLVLTDILFSSRVWAGAWTVPEGNDVTDIASYLRLFEEVGLEVLECEDATRVTWDAWCRALQQWLHQRHAQGRIDDSVYQGWSQIMAGLSRGAVNHYLLVTARRPSHASTG